MFNPRTPFFLPCWAAHLFERVADQCKDERWYEQMMQALLTCDDWDAFHHQQSADVLNQIVLPTAATASDLVRNTITLHQNPKAEEADWTDHYSRLFHATYTPCASAFTANERHAIRACLHACLMSPLEQRPLDPVWSIIHALRSSGLGTEGWLQVAGILLRCARANQTTSTVLAFSTG